MREKLRRFIFFSEGKEKMARVIENNVSYLSGRWVSNTSAGTSTGSTGSTGGTILIFTVGPYSYNEYTDIQTALDAAALVAGPLTPVLIEVEAGTYSGFNVNASFISIRGKGSRSTQISSVPTQVAGVGPVVFDNLAFFTTLTLADTANVQIRDCSILTSIFGGLSTTLQIDTSIMTGELQVNGGITQVYSLGGSGAFFPNVRVVAGATFIANASRLNNIDIFIQILGTAGISTARTDLIGTTCGNLTFIRDANQTDYRVTLQSCRMLGSLTIGSSTPFSAGLYDFSAFSTDFDTSVSISNGHCLLSGCQFRDITSLTGSKLNTQAEFYGCHFSGNLDYNGDVNSTFSASVFDGPIADVSGSDSQQPIMVNCWLRDDVQTTDLECYDCRLDGPNLNLTGGRNIFQRCEIRNAMTFAGNVEFIHCYVYGDILTDNNLDFLFSYILGSITGQNTDKDITFVRSYFTRTYTSTTANDNVTLFSSLFTYAGAGSALNLSAGAQVLTDTENTFFTLTPISGGPTITPVATLSTL